MFPYTETVPEYIRMNEEVWLSLLFAFIYGCILILFFWKIKTIFDRIMDKIVYMVNNDEVKYKSYKKFKKSIGRNFSIMLDIILVLGFSILFVMTYYKMISNINNAFKYKDISKEIIFNNKRYMERMKEKHDREMKFYLETEKEINEQRQKEFEERRKKKEEEKLKKIKEKKVIFI